MFHYVYRIDRPSKGEWYIGIRSCECWPTEDTKYMGSGVRVSRIERSQLRRTVLVIVKSRAEAARIEAALVLPATLDDKMCLNRIAGGGRGCLGMVHTQQARDKIGRANMGNESRLGVPHTQEAKDKIRDTLTGRKATEETKAKMRAAWVRRKTAK